LTRSVVGRSPSAFNTGNLRPRHWPLMSRMVPVDVDFGAGR